MKRFVLGIVLVCLAMPGVVRADSASDLDQHVVGAWTLELTDPEGVQRTPMVIVGRQYEKYVAWYIGEGEPEAFQDVQLKGETLIGSLSPKERPDVKLTLEATWKGDGKCQGTAKYRDNQGHSGSFEFTGQRMAMSAFDEVSTWKLTFNSPDHEKHEPTITVVSKDGKRYAWYGSRDHQLPVRSLSVQDDTVVASLTAETREGEQVDVTFRGTVMDETVKGSVEYQVGSESGSFPFEGKRES